MTKNRYAKHARAISERHDEDHLGFLRELNSYTEDRLVDEDWLEERTGAEVKSPSYWTQQRKEARPQSYYDFLVKDCLETHFVFYREFHGYSDDNEFMDAVLEDDLGLGSEEKVVKAYQQFEDTDVPDGWPPSSRTGPVEGEVEASKPDDATGQTGFDDWIGDNQ